MIGSSEDFNLVEPADSDVGELAVGVAREINVVCDRTCVQHGDAGKRWLCIEHLCLSYVLERKPHLFAVWGSGDVRTEGRGLLHPANYLVGLGIDHHRFRCEA